MHIMILGVGFFYVVGISFECIEMRVRMNHIQCLLGQNVRSASSTNNEGLHIPHAYYNY